MSRRKIKPPPTVDRISALPDELLRHILSFLPTNLAFTTTVLSKRWTPLFYSLTAFHFDYEGAIGRVCRRFRCFVDTVLLSPRVQHQPIVTLSLTSRFYGCASKLEEWVEAAKLRGVENLHFSSPTRLLPLSPRIFTSRTLVVLKLNGFDMGGRGDFESVDLPSLKTLHLIESFFGKREDFKKLLSVCPNLVDLYASFYFLNDAYNYTTGYKTMPKLEKACISSLDVPFTMIYNVQFLRIEWMERRCSDKCVDSYYREMPVFRNLISIELCFHYFCGWDRVVEVLPYCPKLQTLVIEKRVHGESYKEKWAYIEEPVPECDSLHLTTYSIGNYQIQGKYSVDDFKFAAYIMQNAKLLQVMTLHIDPDAKFSEKDRFFKHLSICPRISPACKLQCKYSS